MDKFTRKGTTLPAEQEAIRAKCFHPSGAFVEFQKGEIEQSISTGARQFGPAGCQNEEP